MIRTLKSREGACVWSVCSPTYLQPQLGLFILTFCYYYESI